LSIMARSKKRAAIPFLLLIALTLSLFAAIGGAAAAGADTAEEYGPAVYVIPVKHTVESGLESFLKRAFKEAEKAKAEHIILVINTFGGAVTNAEAIGSLVANSPIPVTAFVEGKAVSAGTFIALNADSIVMQPGSTIGAAAVVNGSTGKLIDDPKTISYWSEHMKSAAESTGRDPRYAIAMVDVNADIKLGDELGRDKKPGEILSLSASDAMKVGYAEHTAKTVEEVISWLDLSNRTVIEVNPSIAENIARWLVSPVVMTILLILGIAGVAIELLIPGFGAPGIVGVSAFALYFFGHYVAGFAGAETIVLFVLGLALLIIELFVPSFGILGLLGGASLITGVTLAAANPMTAFISLIIAVILAIVIVAIVARTNKGRGVWNKFILRDKLTTEEGYISAEEKISLLGKEGTAVTALRPAGTVRIGDDRIDVVTSGEFIDANRPVKVIKAEGTWVVVKEIKE